MGEERLTDTHRRALCELIGECWHEETFDEEIDCYRCSCGMRFSIEGQLHGHIQNDNEYRTRTFTTWEDYGRCIEAIKEKGLVKDFIDYMITRNLKMTLAGFVIEMLDPARCLEVAEFIMQRKEKE